MNKVKTTIFTVVFGFILGVCGSNIYASDDSKDTFKYIDSFERYNGIVEIFQYVDQETGVNYIVLGSWHKSGARYEGITITPKLNNDGTLCITK